MKNTLNLSKILLEQEENWNGYLETSIKYLQNLLDINRFSPRERELLQGILNTIEKTGKITKKQFEIIKNKLFPGVKVKILNEIKIDRGFQQILDDFRRLKSKSSSSEADEILGRSLIDLRYIEGKVEELEYQIKKLDVKVDKNYDSLLNFVAEFIDLVDEPNYYTEFFSIIERFSLISRERLKKEMLDILSDSKIFIEDLIYDEEQSQDIEQTVRGSY